MVRAIEIETDTHKKDARECSFGVEGRRIQTVRFGYHRRSDGRRLRITLGALDFFAHRESLRLDGLPCSSRDVIARIGRLMEEEGAI